MLLVSKYGNFNSTVLSTLFLLFVLQKSIPVILQSVLLGENVKCMLQLTQHTASHLVILTMEAVSQGRHAAWSTRHAMNSHAHHGLSAVSIQRALNYLISWLSVLCTNLKKHKCIYTYLPILSQLQWTHVLV